MLAGRSQAIGLALMVVVVVLFAMLLLSPVVQEREEREQGIAQVVLHLRAGEPWPEVLEQVDELRRHELGRDRLIARAATSARPAPAKRTSGFASSRQAPRQLQTCGVHTPSILGANPAFTT